MLENNTIRQRRPRISTTSSVKVASARPNKPFNIVKEHNRRQTEIDDFNTIRKMTNSSSWSAFSSIGVE